MSQTKAQLIDNLVQPITGALGSASAPTFSFTADPNTGVYSPGADQLALSTGGTRRLSVNASGDVGINTTSPLGKLHVVGALNSTALYLEDAAGDTPYRSFAVASSGNGLTWDINVKGSSSSVGGTLTFSTNSAERMRLDSTGRLGLGTTSPSSTLDVRGLVSLGDPAVTGSARKHFVYTGGAVTSDTTNGLTFKPGSASTTDQFVRFETGGGTLVGAFGAVSDRLSIWTRDTSNALTISQSGRLGIGTIGPLTELVVSSTSDPIFRLDNSTTSITAGSTIGGIEVYTNDTSIDCTGVKSFIRTIAGNFGSGQGNADLTFGTASLGAGNAAERVRITGAGNVGIGTTSVNDLLHIKADSSGGATRLRVENGFGATNTSSQVYFNCGGAQANIAGLVAGANENSGLAITFGVSASATTPTERMRLDQSGRLLVGKSTATGAAIFQVQTPTTLSTTNDEGVEFTNTSAKVYPTTASFGVTAGLSQNIELSTAQVIDTVTPGGFNFVYGIQNVLTKSAGNTQDIERLYFTGFNQTFTWADANTCKQYASFTDVFNYSGYNANSRTSSSFAAGTVSLNAPDTRTQTIANITSDSLRVAPAGTSTVAITSWASQSPGLLLLSASTGTKTCTLTDAVFYDTSTIWGTSVTTGTLAATITNLFGLRLRPPASTTGLTVTNNWGLYQEWSSAKNWFAGASNQYPNITTTASGANAFLDSANSNRLYRSTSSLTYKRDVEDLDSNLADQILNLRPVWYRSKCDSDCQDWSWYGLIAEEVAEIDPRFVHYGYQEDAYEFVDVTETVELPPSDPRREEGIETEEVTRQERQLKADAQQVPNGVAYERLVVPLLDIIKRQKSQLDSFEARLAALEAQ